jgi:hypothetical protein
MASFFVKKTLCKKCSKQAVKRNIQRFPIDFMFEMTRKELILLKSQAKASAEKVTVGCATYLFALRSKE